MTSDIVGNSILGCSAAIDNRKFEFATVEDAEVTIWRYSATKMNGRKVAGNYDDDIRVVGDLKIIGNSDGCRDHDVNAGVGNDFVVRIIIDIAIRVIDYGAVRV